MLDWQQTSQPALVHNTSSVDVVKAAIGTRHAALITRAGELYTWGYGQGERGDLGPVRCNRWEKLEQAHTDTPPH